MAAWRPAELVADRWETASARTLVLRLVRTPDSVWLDPGGTGVVRIRLGL